MYVLLCLLALLIRVFVRTIDSRSRLALKIPLSEAVKAPITAKDELFDVEMDCLMKIVKNYL